MKQLVRQFNQYQLLLQCKNFARSIEYNVRVLTHISSVLCYMCRGVWALGSNESPEICRCGHVRCHGHQTRRCVRKLYVFRTSANGRGRNLTCNCVRGTARHWRVFLK